MNEENKMKKCPYCGEEILESAKKCKHCKEWLWENSNSETNTKLCPYCGEEINKTAQKCKYCNSWLVENKPAQKYEYCPFCQKPIPQNAEKCPYCSEWLRDEHDELSCGYGFRNPIVRFIHIICLIGLVISLVISIANQSAEGVGLSVAIVFIFWIGMYLYLLPSIFAASRKHPQLVPIFLINLFFGETIIGWVGALVWATMHRQGRHTHW